MDSQHADCFACWPQSSREALKALPIYRTASGSPSHVAIDPGLRYYTFDQHDLFAPTKPNFLSGCDGSEQLLSHLGVEHLREVDIWKEFLIPHLPGLDPSQRTEHLARLRSDWPRLKGDKLLCKRLSTTPFVPIVSGELLAPSRLIDPRNEILSSILESEGRCPDPDSEFATNGWLDFLAELGMKSTMDRDAYWQCIEQIRSWPASKVAEDPDCAKKALATASLFVHHFDMLADGEDGRRLLQDLSKVKVLPRLDPTAPGRQTMRLYAYAECVIPENAYLCWLYCPVLTPDVLPPAAGHGALGISTEVPTDIIVENLCRISSEAFSPEKWPFSRPPAEVMSKILRVIVPGDTHKLSHVQISRLRSVPFLPVLGMNGECSATVVPNADSPVQPPPPVSQFPFRMFLGGATYHPFTHQLPHCLRPFHKPLLAELGVRHHLPTKDIPALLNDIAKRDAMDRRLCPTEFTSYCSLLSEAHGAGRDLSQVHMVDEDCRLCAKHLCLLKTHPWLLDRVKREHFHLAHPALSSDKFAGLGLTPLHEALHDELAPGFTPTPCSEPWAPAKQATMQRLVCSLPFAVGLCAAADKELPPSWSDFLATGTDVYQSVHQILAQFSVHIVTVLTSRFLLQTPSMPHPIDITSKSEGTLWMAMPDAGKILLVHPESPPQPPLAGLLARAVLKLLALPPISVVPDLLSCETPDQIPEVMVRLQIPLSTTTASASSLPAFTALSVGVSGKGTASRGTPGYPVLQEDLPLLSILPLRIPAAGEIVAWDDKAGVPRYGLVQSVLCVGSPKKPQGFSLSSVRSHASQLASAVGINPEAFQNMMEEDEEGMEPQLPADHPHLVGPHPPVIHTARVQVGPQQTQELPCSALKFFSVPPTSVDPSRTGDASSAGMAHVLGSTCSVAGTRQGQPQGPLALVEAAASLLERAGIPPSLQQKDFMEQVSCILLIPGMQ